jgi:hypothetical protein
MPEKQRMLLSPETLLRKPGRPANPVSQRSLPDSTSPILSNPLCTVHDRRTPTRDTHLRTRLLQL